MSYPPPPAMGSPLGGMPPKPSTHLAWSILTTLFCCLPLGIVAIIQSTKVDSLYTSGQYAASEKASADARKWNLWGLGIGLAVIVLYVAFLLIAAMGASTSNSIG